jgi:IclR family KDG regulon transcriptional repressor
MAFLPDDEMEELLPRLHLERLTPQTITDLDELRQELSRTRERGYAVNNEEQEKGVRAVGVPIINRRDLPVASISLPTLTFRYSMKELEEFVPLLHKAAKEISVQLP